MITESPPPHQAWGTPLPSSRSCARRRAWAGGRGRCLLCGGRRRGTAGELLGWGGCGTASQPAAARAARAGALTLVGPAPPPLRRPGHQSRPGEGAPAHPTYGAAARAPRPCPIWSPCATPRGSPPPRSVALDVRVSVCAPLCPVSPLACLCLYPGHLHARATVAGAVAWGGALGVAEWVWSVYDCQSV